MDVKRILRDVRMLGVLTMSDISCNCSHWYICEVNAMDFMIKH